MAAHGVVPIVEKSCVQLPVLSSLYFLFIHTADYYSLWSFHPGLQDVYIQHFQLFDCVNTRKCNRIILYYIILHYIHYIQLSWCKGMALDSFTQPSIYSEDIFTISLKTKTP